MNLKNLRIADLELFISAARLNSLGKAAALHHLSQSAASTAVQRVEGALGASLCTHEKRQFRLTRIGQVLLPKAETWLKQIREMSLGKDKVPLRLVTTHALAQSAIPELLEVDQIDFKQMRPDHAYAAIIHDEADLALVLDNSPWKGVMAAEVGEGHFQLYSRKKEMAIKPILLPEDQLEVLLLQQSWQEVHHSSLPVKARIPSWSLIAHICAHSDQIGFLPDFLAKKHKLHPVLWQPVPSSYRILALYRNVELLDRLEPLLQCLLKVF